MGNRKQPFGYKMERGTVVIQTSEAEVVQWIYERYNQGDSYAALVCQLKEQPVPYMPGKLWNKNMVARILEDERYIGAQDYPMIIEKASADYASIKRKTKQAPNAGKTDVQKILRQFSGSKVTDRMEHTVLSLLNDLITSPEQIKEQPEMFADAPKIQALEQELDLLLTQMPTDAVTAKQVALELAAEQYTTISESGYETERLKRFLGEKKPMVSLDVDLLKNIVVKIEIRGDGMVSLRLKNGQVIEERSASWKQKEKKQ